MGAAGAAAFLAALAVARYPVAPALLATILMLYGAALWRWPMLWLSVVPAALPAFDLAPWTGWSEVEESDLVVLVTLAVLILRWPPRRRDFALGVPAGVAIAMAIAVSVIGVARGLAAPALPDGSAIAYLRPDNALRIAKGFMIALALLPFLRRAMAERADAPVRFAAGMTAGLALVAAAAAYERATFTGLFDFDRPYRIVATFSSMQFGGGYVGVYVAMALPFALVLLRRQSGAGLVLAAAVMAGGLYTLIVTFARAALGSAAVGCVTLVLGRLWAAHINRARPSSFALTAALLAVALGVAVAALYDSEFMEFRMSRVVPDLASREQMWRNGLALRRGGPVTTLFGMGLGSYARSHAAALPLRARPSNVVDEDGYVAVSAGLPLYLGQRVAVAPDTLYHLSFAMRTAMPGTVIAAELCEKMMLYSIACRTVSARPTPDDQWQRFDAAINSDPIGRATTLRFFRRPVELALVLPVPGTAAFIGDVRLTDPQGRGLLTNGDFARGLTRWFFTDDVHSVWRIENQYLMTLFEEGLVGVASFLLLAAVAAAGAAGAVARGDRLAPAFLAALAAFLASGLFDCPLEVPRLAAVFYLVAFAAMTMGESARGVSFVKDGRRTRQ